MGGGWSVRVALLPGSPLDRLPLQQRAQLPFEVGDLLEVLVDAGEPEIGDLVDVPELPEDLDADLLRGDLRPLPTEPLLDPVDELLHLEVRDRPVLGGLEDAGRHLLPPERVARAVPLADDEPDVLDPLVGGEAPVAGIALAPTADRRSAVGGPGVHDPVVVGTAPRTSHEIDGHKI